MRAPASSACSRRPAPSFPARTSRSASAPSAASRAAACCARRRNCRLSEDHDGIMELPADAPVGAAYAEWAGLGDPVIEINLTPNRQDCTGVHGIARDLAAADMGKFKDPGDQADQGRIPLPGEGDGRGRQIVSGLCAAAGARRQERPLAGMAAEAPDLDRPAADQRAGRYHQLHDLRPRPAAACVRCGQGQGRSHRAPRAATARRCWRSTAAPTRSTTMSA